MSDAAEVRALLAEARKLGWRKIASYPIDAQRIIGRLAAALEAAHAEPDAELSRTDRAEFVRVFAKWFAMNPPTEHETTVPTCPDDPPTEPRKVRQWNFYGLFEAFTAAGFRRSARVPVSRDELASRMKWLADPEEAAVLARAFHRDYDIYPKADRKPADSQNGDDRG